MKALRMTGLIGCALFGLMFSSPDALSQWTTLGSITHTSTGINKVGIGTTTPVKKLDVNGDADIATDLYWGSRSAMLRNDQGGSIELGASDVDTSGGTPYIDFHYGNLVQDYNVRLLNNANGMLSLAATTFYTYANLGLNTTTPLARVHINNGGMLATGTTGATPTSGAGTRLMWIPAKSAFRAGVVSGTQWDDANIGVSSVALGNSTRASGNYSLAAGNGTKASGTSASAFGTSTIANGLNTFAIGDGTFADAIYSFAGGQYSSTSSIGAYTFAFGLSDTVIQAYSVAFGENNRVSGMGSFAAGGTNLVDGSYAMAMGRWDSVYGSYSVAFGSKNTVTDDNAAAFGAGNTVTGYQAFAANGSNTASGVSSATFGIHNAATGQAAAAFGGENTASGLNSFALGEYTTASGNYSVSMGNHTTAQAYKSLVMGRYNVISGNPTSWVATDPAFVIGNGTGTGVNASNAITIYKNGNLLAAGSGTFNGSDVRLKRDITPATGLLAKLANIQPVYYSFIDTETRPAGRQLGFIAQEIEKEFPEMVMRDEKGYLAVAYGNMSAVAIQAIKEQQQKIDAISAEKGDVSAQLAAANARIANQDAHIAEQDARIARIEAMLLKLAGECCPEPAGIPVLK